MSLSPTPYPMDCSAVGISVLWKVLGTPLETPSPPAPSLRSSSLLSPCICLRSRGGGAGVGPKAAELGTHVQNPGRSPRQDPGPFAQRCAAARLRRPLILQEPSPKTIRQPGPSPAGLQPALPTPLPSAPGRHRPNPAVLAPVAGRGTTRFGLRRLISAGRRLLRPRPRGWGALNRWGNELSPSISE